MDLQHIFDFLNSLYGVPKVILVFFFCLMCGWIIKRCPWVHNSSIPVIVSIIGAVSLPVLSDFEKSSIQTVRVFIFTNVVIGFIAGALSTIVYKFVIKKLLAKVGVDDGPSDPPWPNADSSNVNPDPKARIQNPPTLPNKP